MSKYRGPSKRDKIKYPLYKGQEVLSRNGKYLIISGRWSEAWPHNYIYIGWVVPFTDPN